MKDSSLGLIGAAMLHMEIIMHKLSHRTLVILIAILSTAIIVLLALTLKNDPSILDKLSKLSNSANSLLLKILLQSLPQNPPIVIIDAGHGGWEPGAGNGSIHERDITLAISLEVEKVLKEKNIDYYMTRSDDTYVSLEDRVRIANEKGCKLFVSIHNNSFTNTAQSGILDNI